jgi:hypothetical protein
MELNEVPCQLRSINERVNLENKFKRKKCLFCHLRILCNFQFKKFQFQAFLELILPI